MGIFDALRGKAAPAVSAKLPAARNRPLGVGGAVISGGYLDTPEKDARVVGRRKYVTYSEIMTNTSIVAAGTRYFLNLVTKARWKVATPDDNAESKKYAERVEKIMGDMMHPWHQYIRRAAMYRFYGFSIQEWTAKINDDGDVGFSDLGCRPQSTVNQWLTNSQGHVLGIIQQSPNTGEFIPIPREKLIYLVDDTLSDTPEGLGIFRHIVEPATRLKQYTLLESFGFESDLQGTPIGRAPYNLLNDMVAKGTMTAAERDRLLTPIETFARSHLKGPNLALVLDSEMWRGMDEAAAVSASPKFDMDVLRVGLGGTLQQNGVAIDRVNHEIARILGCEHLLMGGNDRGSYAMSKDKTANFYLMVDAAIQEINAVYQTDWLDKLWLLNGWPQERKPKFVPETLKFSDVDQMAGALRDMALAGAVIAPDDEAVDAIREILGLPNTPDAYAGLPAGGEKPQPAAGGQTQGTPTSNAAKPKVPAKVKKALQEIAALAVEANV